MRFLTPASLSIILFNIRPMFKGLIYDLLGLAGSRHKCTLPLVLGARAKLLYHSGVSCMPNCTIICSFCSLTSSSINGYQSAYVTHGGALFGQLPYLICKLNVSPKHPIPERILLNSLCIVLIPGLLFCLLFC